MFSRFPPFPFALLVTLFMPWCAFAQTSSNSTAVTVNKEDAPQKVEITGKYEERRHDTASKIVVNRDEFLRFGDSNVSDVLKRLPGISSNGGQIRFRGLGNGYTQVLLNGEQTPPGFQIDSLSPDLIEKIEILRSASAEFSTQAIAGTINIVTLKTVKAAVRQVKLSLGDETGDRSVFLNLNHSDNVGALSYTLNTHIVYGFTGQPSVYQRQVTDAQGELKYLSHSNYQIKGNYNGIALTPRLNWKFQNGDTFTLQSLLRINRNGNHNSEDEILDFGSPSYISKQKTDFHTEAVNVNNNLNWIHKLGDGSKLDLKLGLNFTKRVFFTDFTGFDQANQAQIQSNRYNNTSDSSVTNQGKYSLNSANDHTFITGWDASFQQKNDYFRQMDSMPAGADPLKFDPRNLNQTYTVRVKRLAIFAQDEWNVTKALSLYLGLRWEGVETGSSSDSSRRSTNRVQVTSPIVQTLYKFLGYKNTQMRFALARTYRPPTFNDLSTRIIFSNENAADRPDSQGNPNLRPELAWGVDLGIEHFLGKGGLLSANLFTRRINEVISPEMRLADKRYVVMPVNAGRGQSHGIELEAKFPLSLLLQNAPAIDFRFSMNRTWSRVASVPGPHNRLAGQTPLSFNLGLDYKRDQFSLGGSFSWKNSGNLRTSAWQASYASVTRNLDLYGVWALNKQFQVRVTGTNLLHQDNLSQNSAYFESGGITQSTRTSNPTMVRIALESTF